MTGPSHAGIGFVSDRAAQRAAAIAALRTLRTRKTLQGIDIRTLRGEDRA